MSFSPEPLKETRSALELVIRRDQDVVIHEQGVRDASSEGAYTEKMKFGFRMPSLKKRLLARASPARFVRHNLGLKAPRGWGWLSNPRKAAYNRVYNRTTFAIGRSRSRGSGCGCLGAVLAMALIGALCEAVSSVPPVALAALGGAALAAFAAVTAFNRKATAEAAARTAALVEERKADLGTRFGAAAADAIIAHQVWMGATVEMVRESIGEPAAIDERVLKSKVKHTFKYQPTGRTRFALRVYIENGRVVGWSGPASEGFGPSKAT